MPRIEALRVGNYRTLRDLKLDGLQPLTVLVGPNGCGKSTLFDVFGFLADALQTNVRKALEPRGRLRELRSRGSTGPVVIELTYQPSALADQPQPHMTYHLEIDEEQNRPVVVRETLASQSRRGLSNEFLRIEHGSGHYVPEHAATPSGLVDLFNIPIESELTRGTPVKLDSPDILAIKALGQLADNPRVASLRRFIEGWFLSYFVPDRARQVPEAGANEHLSRTGENLPNVIQYLSEEHPQILAGILRRLSRRIPGLEKVEALRTEDGRLALRFKDQPFPESFLARFVSDGTIKMLAYLVLLSDPQPPPLLCIEEPENGLHPKLLPLLAEELRAHSGTTQVLVSTHSPYLANALRPDELWVMDRGPDGFTRAERADRVPGVLEFIKEGGVPGDLWLEGFLGRGNP